MRNTIKDDYIENEWNYLLKKEKELLEQAIKTADEMERIQQLKKGLQKVRKEIVKFRKI